MLLLALLLAPTLALAQSSLPPADFAYKQLPDPRQEAQASALMRTLRCLVCQGQSIADSDADMAGDMRAEVRRRIAAGRTPEQIRTDFIASYGEWVSYDPPLGRATWLLWAAPIALLAFGALLASRRFRRGRR